MCLCHGQAHFIAAADLSRGVKNLGSQDLSEGPSPSSFLLPSSNPSPTRVLSFVLGPCPLPLFPRRRSHLLYLAILVPVSYPYPSSRSCLIRVIIRYVSLVSSIQFAFAVAVRSTADRIHVVDPPSRFRRHRWPTPDRAMNGHPTGKRRETLSNRRAGRLDV